MARRPSEGPGGRSPAAAAFALALAALAPGCRSSSSSTSGSSAPGPAPGPASTQALPASAAVATANEAPRGMQLLVPHTTAALKIDGELKEKDWKTCARTGVFVDANGADGRPYSDARFLWDEKNLYVAMYAGDDDIEAKVTKHDAPLAGDDYFSLRLTPLGAAAGPSYVLDLSAAGVCTDARVDPSGASDLLWESGISFKVDMDEGTINSPKEEDEEWVIESAIPFASLKLTGAPGLRIAVEVSRCDTPRGTTTPRCAAYGKPPRTGVLELKAP